MNTQVDETGSVAQLGKMFNKSSAYDLTIKRCEMNLMGVLFESVSGKGCQYYDCILPLKNKRNVSRKSVWLLTRRPGVRIPSDPPSSLLVLEEMNLAKGSRRICNIAEHLYLHQPRRVPN